MPQQTSYNNITNIRVDLLFNELQGEQYRPLVIRVQGDAHTSDGGKKEVSHSVNVGSLQNNPLTAGQIYTQLGSVSSLHTQVRNALKQMYINSLSEDISA